MPDKPIPDEFPHDCFSEEEIDNTILGYMLYGASWPWCSPARTRAFQVRR
jgi:hypothetical protein